MKQIPPKKGQQIGLKIALIALLILGLLVPVVLILNLVSERETMRDLAVQETGNMWGREQILGKVIMVVPYTAEVKDRDGNVSIKTKHVHFFPDDLRIEGEVAPVIRKRGIYEAVLYNAVIETAGSMKSPSMSEFPADAREVLWGDAALNIGISDVRGIGQSLIIEWDGVPLEVHPGTACGSVLPEGASAKINIMDGETTNHSFRIKMSVRGSEDLLFVPAGRQTTVSLRSPWQTPSYQGAFLPDESLSTDDGFRASWHISEFNRKLPANWTGKGPDFIPTTFGVKLYRQVDIYRITTRTVKYAVLFIGLTFGVFFLFEVLAGVHLHAVHYILVGFAVTLFYLLLLALSEHIPFIYSYIIASTSTVLLISFYLKGVTGHTKVALGIAMILALLYLLLYILVQLEDYALLVGAVALFGLLASVMTLTRRISWGGTPPGHAG